MLGISVVVRGNLTAVQMNGGAYDPNQLSEGAPRIHLLPKFHNPAGLIAGFVCNGLQQSESAAIKERLQVQSAIMFVAALSECATSNGRRALSTVALLSLRTICLVI